MLNKISFPNPFCSIVIAALLIASLLIGGCGVNRQIPVAPASPPIRFLLTFDDGPSGAIKKKNPTRQILDALRENSAQGGIKAIFFVQTRSVQGGNTETGRLLLRREQHEGHLLAFHTATPTHANHRFLASDAFESSLQNGIDDLTEIAGVMPQLVRPPYWNYDARTLESYHRHGLQMLLTDLSAGDGVSWFGNVGKRKHDNLLNQLRWVRAQWIDGELPAVDGITPVVVTFHDVNVHTAAHMEAYLHMLLQIALELDMPLAEKPFYDDRAEMERAALARVVRDMNSRPRLPGLWNWLWN